MAWQGMTTLQRVSYCRQVMGAWEVELARRGY